MHGEPAEQAVAGQRTALNLAGVATQELARGMMLAPPSTFQSTLATGCFALAAASAKPLKDRARVHLHAYTSETIAEVVLYRQETDCAGRICALPSLRLAEPTLLLPGDRFIMRQFSPVVTIGGGVVLDAAPIPKAAELDSFLKVMAGGDPSAVLVARIARRSHDRNHPFTTRR